MGAPLRVGVAAERARAIAGPETARILFHAPTCSQGSTGCGTTRSGIRGYEAMERPTFAEENIKKLQNAEGIAMDGKRFLTCSLGRNSLSSRADGTTTHARNGLT